MNISNNSNRLASIQMLWEVRVFSSASRRFLRSFFDQIIDIRDYLTCDLKLSDTALNDLFSEFDVNPNDFPYFDPATNTNQFPQQLLQAPVDLPPSYDTALLSATPNNLPQDPHIQSTVPAMDEYISLSTLKSLIEQHQAQQSLVKYASSPPEPVPTNYPEVNFKRNFFFSKNLSSSFQQFYQLICRNTDRIKSSLVESLLLPDVLDLHLLFICPN